MSRFNVSSSHPLIPNSQQYLYDQKYVSIHSEDRDIIKYPSSSQFEIELPQDYCSVQAVKLKSWTFPANYNTFSFLQANISMTFKIIKPYNPGEYCINNPLLYVMMEAMYTYGYDTNYIIIISEGFYNPLQIATELTNRFNAAVTNVISLFMTEYLNDPTLNATLSIPVTQEIIDEFNASGGYNQFVIVYNEVGQKLWFGNKSSQFIISNDSDLYKLPLLSNIQCFQTVFPYFANWGLPAYLGFLRCPVTATPPPGPNPNILPRFYYGEINCGDNGYWLVPDASYGQTPVYYLECPSKVNLMGNAYFYMEINGLNNMDETIPFIANDYTAHTNNTSGVVNSAFAKIAITTTPIAQWYDSGVDSYKYFNPPAERIRKLSITLRYHNGQLVDFGLFDYSFTIEFSMLKPQNKFNMDLYTPNIIYG
jgi:hypothetical protein